MRGWRRLSGFRRTRGGRRGVLVVSAVGLAVVAVAAILTATHTPGDSVADGGRAGGGVPAAGGIRAPGGPAALGLPRVPWAGGPAYYARFPTAAAAGWADPKFFPIGVWFESVLQQGDVDLDKAAGLNTYVELTDNSNMALVRSNGMSAILGTPLPGYGSETVSWLITDEADMTYGPGSDPWTGQGGWNSCIPIQDQRGQCGYSVMQTLSDRLPKDGRPRYANYGKGVLVWESDAEAQRFVNHYTDFTSADLYHYTDPHQPPEDRRAAQYGALIDRMHKLDATDGHRQPIWAFIEVGHPFTENDAPTINGDQIAGAVWNSLIHEARGIIYFNHNFGGPCISQHVLRDKCGAAIRPAVTEINRRVTELAPVLSTQTYQWTFHPALDTMLKEHDGSYYVFAMPGPGSRTGEYTLALPQGIRSTHAEVLYENRQIPIGPTGLTDSFNAEYRHHIYRITP
ncbi:MAG: hypothetical protein ACRDTA_03080 [Pseudonocardiaceae bacterium]